MPSCWDGATAPGRVLGFGLCTDPAQVPQELHRLLGVAACNSCPVTKAAAVLLAASPAYQNGKTTLSEQQEWTLHS